MDNLISVIVPVYNIEEYIGRCIESVLNQTYKNFELLLIIDGATDNSKCICDMWSEKDDRIRVIYKENGGVSSARNYGIKEAQGDYLTFVDGDDYINTEMLEQLLNNMISNDSDVSMCDLCVVHLDGNKSRVDMPDQVFEKKYLIENYFDNPNIKELLWGPCQKLFKKQIIKNLSFKKYALGEDILFIFEVIQKINILSYVNYEGYYYDHREGSASKSAFSRKRFDYIYAAKDVVSICEKNAPYAVETANNWLFKNSLVLFRSIIINNAKKDYPQEFNELKEYLKKNKGKYFRCLNKKRKIDYYLSMYCCIIYKFMKLR